MAVVAVDRDLEQSERQVERARERDGCAAANDGVSEVEWRSAGEVTEAEDGADGGGGGGSRSRAERERASERARMRIRVRDWGGREGMRDWGYSRARLLASWLLRCAYIDQGQGRPAGPAFVGCSLLGQMGHRAITVPACTTVLCPGRAMGQGGGPNVAWSIGPCRHGPAGHRAMPCLCQAKRPGHGTFRRASGRMAFYKFGTFVSEFKRNITEQGVLAAATRQ